MRSAPASAEPAPSGCDPRSETSIHAAGLGDDVGQLLQGVDLLADGAPDGRGRFLGLDRHVDRRPSSIRPASLRVRRGSIGPCGACPRSLRRSAASPTSITSLIELRILSVDSSVRPSAFSSAEPTRFSNDFMTRSSSSDLLTSPTARSSSEDCRSSVCSKFDCAAPIRFDALASSLPCSSKRLAIDATSRSAACDSSVRRLVLASIRRAEVAKVCAAFSVVEANLSVVPGQLLVDDEQVLLGRLDEHVELRARRGKPADQVVDVFRQ